MTHLVLPFPFEPETTVVDERFVIKSELGQGGMGRCYRVLQRNLERLCVLKMLAPKLHPRFVTHTDARVMLENEAKILGLLADGNDSFVQVFDRGTLYARVRREGKEMELDLPYYVMEYLQGQSLEVIIDGAAARQNPLPIDSVVSLCQQAARALRIAHSRSVIHRDVKPDNMFLQERVDRLPTLKLIDFGVSTREGAPHVHGTGTIRYGAPELLSKRVTRESTQSDMYPLGLVFYELAALRGPHVCSSKEDYMWAHVYGEAPDVRQFRLDCPPRFAGLLTALLAKDPALRPTAKQTDDELTAILASLAGGGNAQAQLSHLLPSPRERAARRDQAARTGSGRDQGATLSGSALRPPAHSSQYFSQPGVDPNPPVLRERTQPIGGGHSSLSPSAAAAMRRDTVRGMRQPPVDGPPPMGVGGRNIPDSELSIGAPDQAQLPNVADGMLLRLRDVAVPLTESAADPPGGASSLAVDAAEGGGIEDIPNVPVFRSMGQIFDAVWEDDTRYQPSIFDTAQMPRPPVRLEAAFFSRGEASSAPLQEALVHDVQASRNVPRVRRRRVLQVALIGMAAAALLAVGLRQVSWGRAVQPSAPLADPAASAALNAEQAPLAVSVSSETPVEPPSSAPVEAPAFDGPTTSATRSVPGPAIASVPRLPRTPPAPRASGAHTKDRGIFDDSDPWLTPPKPSAPAPSASTFGGFFKKFEVGPHP